MAFIQIRSQESRTHGRGEIISSCLKHVEFEIINDVEFEVPMEQSARKFHLMFSGMRHELK